MESAEDKKINMLYTEMCQKLEKDYPMIKEKSQRGYHLWEQYLYGYMLLEGIGGVEKNSEKGREFLKSTAKRGGLYALRCLEDLQLKVPDNDINALKKQIKNKFETKKRDILNSSKVLEPTRMSRQRNG
jgi:TPR repeat protein